MDSFFIHYFIQIIYLKGSIKMKSIRNLKKSLFSTISLALIVTFLSTFFCIPAFAARDLSPAESKAAELKQLGLFKGVSDTDFALDRAPTRIESIVMLIRMLGKEQEALASTGQHPFNDVETWANKYIGYAYEKGLTKGVSETQFGKGNANVNMYLTFVLRALGYSDSSGDFKWDDPATLATSVGILTSDIDSTNFLRADVALISYAALSANIKDSEQTMAEKLISDGVFTKDKYDELTMGQMTGSASINVSSEAELIAALANDTVDIIVISSPIETKKDIVNNKKIQINAAFSMIECKMTNNGTLSVNSELTFGGTDVINNNNFIVSKDSTMKVYMADFDNKGQFTISANGSVDIDRGAYLNNHALVSNDGKINIGVEGGNLFNYQDATIVNNGTITIYGYYNDEGGKIIGKGTLNTENSLSN